MGSIENHHIAIILYQIYNMPADSTTFVLYYASNPKCQKIFYKNFSKYLE